MSLTVIVLAAGAGTRMRSARPKVLHEIGGRSLLHHVVAAARGLSPDLLIVVVGHGRDRVVAHLADIDPRAQPVAQQQQRGTGDAVRSVLASRPELAEQPGTVIVTTADTPLLDTGTLRHLAHERDAANAAVAVLTATVADPIGYGRVLRAADGSVMGIVEHRDADPAQQAITEINSGVYAFSAVALPGLLAALSSDNAAGELYLPDVVGVAVAAGLPVSALRIEDPLRIEGVNDRVQLAALGAELNRRTVHAWMRSGVTVVDPTSTRIDVAVRLEPDVTLLPNTTLQGSTTVAADAVIGPDTTLDNVRVGAAARVVRTHGSDAVLGEGTSVGPFAYLRPGTVLGAQAKIGTFVETKNVTIGDGSKIPHLTYAGDASIGVGTNIGASSVFVNYDGLRKHRTSIGDHCRTGSDTMFVAPVEVGDGAYTGAGTVVRRDVPPGALAINVAPQRNIEGWVGRNRPGSAAAAAGARAHGSAAGPADDASAGTADAAGTGQTADGAVADPAVSEAPPSARPS